VVFVALSPQVIEKDFAGGQMGTQKLVLLIEFFKRCMEQWQENIQSGKERG
jgi:hypothetical protein